MEVPDPEIVAEESVHTRFVELVVTVRVTVAPNPFSDAIAIVDVPSATELTGTVNGEEEIVKLGTGITYFAVAECVRLPLVPVTVAR